MADGTPVMYRQQSMQRTYYFVQQNKLIPFFRTDGKTATVLQKIHSDCVVLYKGKQHLLEKNNTRLTALPIPQTQLWQYAFDRGGLWCATEKGLYRVWNNGFRYFSEQQVPYCWGVVEDKQQQHWFLNYQSPLLRFNGQAISRVPGYEKTILADNNTVADNWYYHSIRDQYGLLWLTNFTGAIRYDGKRFLRITDPVQPQTMCLLEDPARNLILKGGLSQVLFIENRPPFRFTRFDKSTGFNDPNPFVLSMSEDPDGSYWFGGLYLTHYDYDQKKTTY